MCVITYTTDGGGKCLTLFILKLLKDSLLFFSSVRILKRRRPEFFKLEEVQSSCSLALKTMTRITKKLHRYIFNFPIIKSQLFWLNPFNKAENLHFSYILIEFKCLIVQNFIDPTISSFSCSCYNCIVTMLSIIHNLLSNLTSVADMI